MTTTSARLLQIITTSITVRERWSESNFQVARDHDVGLPLIGRASVTVSINVYATYIMLTEGGNSASSQHVHVVFSCTSSVCILA